MNNLEQNKNGNKSFLTMSLQNSRHLSEKNIKNIHDIKDIIGKSFYVDLYFITICIYKNRFSVIF